MILIDGRILMLRRPEGASSYPGRWSLCAGKIEEGEDPESAAAREIMEETGIEVGKPLGSIEPILVREKNRIWRVRPFIFRADGMVPSLNKENVAYRLCHPEDVMSCGKLVEGTPEAVKSLLELTR
ncbi:MAG: NUDIX domain-containing protein [Candidatus Methanomethylophilaceae archaeon]|nr:NUDIX domain-containing protein [Candidatus Thermoplasmatota archaeon]